MMRKMGGRRRHRLELGYCPNCASDCFQPGPKGGLAQNFECAMCGERYNITLHRGEVVLAQYIGRRDSSRPDDWAEYRRLHAVQRLRGRP